MSSELPTEDKIFLCVTLWLAAFMVVLLVAGVSLGWVETEKKCTCECAGRDK